jgi:hypothetical protein
MGIDTNVDLVGRLAAPIVSVKLQIVGGPKTAATKPLLLCFALPLATL